MTRTKRRRDKGERNPRRVSVRAVRRTQPDTKQLSRALITYALQQAADEAAAEAAQRTRPGKDDADA